MAPCRQQELGGNRLFPGFVRLARFLSGEVRFFRVISPQRYSQFHFDSDWGFQMRYPTLIFSLLCMMLSASAANAERRVAFVVGNGTYKNVAQLPNPPIDAKAMAGVLRNVGFEVVEGTNLTRDKMTEKLLDF